VLVRLNVGFRPEGPLAAPAAVADQHQAIDAAQSGVISALSGMPHTLVRKYESVPLLAVEVDPQGLST
jgi:hypothetical protein